MGKNTQNQQNRSLLDTQRTQSEGGYNNFLGGVSNELGESRRNAASLSSQIRDRYSDPNNFMPAGLRPSSSGFFNLPEDSYGGGGSAGGDYGSAKAGYQRFADTGGRENFADAESSYKNFINSGGVDATALRNRATAQIPAFYDAYRNSANRRANVQGGYSPGFDAQQAELGRQQAREGFNASRQVEGDIADKVQAGRMFGTTGMYNIGGATSGGKLSGLGGLKGIGDAEQQNAQFNAGLGESRSSRNQAMQLALQQMYQSGGLEGARGLQNLYSSAPGDVGQNLDAILRGMGQRDSSSLGNLGLRSGIRDKNWTDYLNQIIGAGGGIASGAFSGGAA